MSTITANSTIGIYLISPPGTNPIVISPGVAISNTLNGVYGFDGAWTIVNNGSISAPSYSGVYLGAGGSVTNAASASITGFDGVNIAGGAATVVNNGSIVGSSLSSIGVVLAAEGSVTNQSGGTISGYTGVDLTSGGMVTNAASASITGVYEGVFISGAAGSLVNFGSIAGTGIGGVGILLGSGGSITNAASASVTGTVVGVDLSAGGTLTNAGAIVGNGGTAVVFGGTSGNLLVLDPGYQLLGIAIGGTYAGAINTLELASAASAGTLSGLGTQFVYFAQTTIDPDASWTLTGSNTLAAGSTLTELSGSTLTVAGTFVNDGVITLDPSTLTVANMTGTGSVIINSGSTLEVQTALAPSNTIQFGGIGAYLRIDTPGSVAATVTNFDLGETIYLKGIDPLSVTFNSDTLNFPGGTLSFSGGILPLSLALPGLIVAVPGGDGAAVTALSLCFCVDTMILTPTGECRVQDLAIGDLVVTLSGVQRPVMWIGAGKVLATRGRRTAATPVIVRKGALADNVPCRDLRITKGHALWLNGVLIPVEELINHRTIEWDDRAQEVVIYHIELESHDVLIANGAPAESYRDDGNRWLFQNGNAGWHLPPQRPCAPLLTNGPVVDATWQQLKERAGPRRGLPLTDDPDLHLSVEGRRVNPSEWRENGAVVFRLDSTLGSVRIRSRSAVPLELGTARDPRMLGVAVRQLILIQGRRLRTISALSLESEGYHAYEPTDDVRWTNGDAEVPAEMFGSMRGPVILTVELGGRTQYLHEGPSEHEAVQDGPPRSGRRVG